LPILGRPRYRSPRARLLAWAGCVGRS